MISVVIPLYNKEKQIVNTLETVINQTYQDFEIVIVNDGSTDNSLAEAQSISDPRIRIISQTNAGVSAARNRGIEEANGEYIALLDADDEWTQDYLETIVALIVKFPECDIFTTRYNFIDEYGKIKPSVLNCFQSDTENNILEDYFHVASNSDAPLWTSAVVVSKRALLSVGGFPIGITSGEDLLTWARLAARYKIGICNKAMSYYYTPTTGPTGKVPADLQSTNDAVGTTLISLSKQFPNIGIDEYVSFWYKMRAVINIRRGNRIPAFRCALKSIRFRPTNIKSWCIVFFSFMPEFLIRKILR